MNDAMTKERLLTTLANERARWESLLGEVGEARMMEPGVAGFWSMKDLLAHLTAYQRTWGARIRGEVTGVPPTPRDLYDVELLPEGVGTWTLDEQNEAIRAQYDPLPLPVVLAKWRETSDLLAAGVTDLSEADLTTPGRFVWAGDRPLAEAMAGDTYGHAQLHAADVRAWLDRAGA
jgi:uncharacterized damage-inducible protein DinB